MSARPARRYAIMRRLRSLPFIAGIFPSQLVTVGSPTSSPRLGVGTWISLLAILAPPSSLAFHLLAFHLDLGIFSNLLRPRRQTYILPAMIIKRPMPS
ncbi:hypothetical protein B0H17DRAFT_1038114 [Mycena rosella]|uniref:Uncharacterized protein n=1 Tax=Mycena rosella TaxID=1033263 RepID=A0AAD7GUG9_MYCRO|nr:hypothetical protein B0H17DRAFT_1038114 [Mycena rosella]